MCFGLGGLLGILGDFDLGGFWAFGLGGLLGLLTWGLLTWEAFGPFGGFGLGRL